MYTRRIGCEGKKFAVLELRKDAGQPAEVIERLRVPRLATDHLLELNEQEKTRIFNLGYYTWVEQQMVSEDAFEARRQQTFWRDLRNLLPIWDEMIVDFNRRTGLA